MPRRRESRVTLMFTARPDRHMDLASAVTVEAAALAASVSPDTSIRITVRQPEVDFGGLHLARTMNPEIPFDLTLTVLSPGEEAPECGHLKGITERLSCLIRPERTALTAGHQLRFFGKTDGLAMQAILIRRADLSREQMQTHWRDVHTALGIYAPFGGYVQYHAETDPTRHLAADLGIRKSELDGITEPYFRDLDHFYECMFHPDMRVAARDEPNFLHRKECSFAVSRSVDLAVRPDRECR